MNRRNRNFAICLITALFMAVIMPFQAVVAFAASAKITFNDPKPTVGTEFTVTVGVSTSDGNMGGADIALSYDPAVIEFVSGSNANGGAGTVRLVGTMDSANTKSLSFNLKFKAVQAGDTKISVSSSEIYDADMQAMTVGHAGSSSVKVQAPATYSSEASLASLKISPGALSPAFSPDVTSYTASVGSEVNKIAVSAERKDAKAKLVVSGDSNLQPGENKVVCKVTAEDGKTVKSYTITVTKAASAQTETESQSQAESESAETTEETAVVGDLKAEIDGMEYLVAASFDQSWLPSGFTASTASYQDSEVMSGVNGDLTILYLQDGEGNGSFWFYDTESEELTPYANIHVSERNITVLPIDSSIEIPEGFSETAIQLNGDCKVEGWVWKTDKEQRYCVVYGMNENGEKGLYRYDIGEKTIQRYFEDPALQSSYSDEEVEAFLQEYNGMYKLYRLRLVLIIVLAVVCLILLTTVILLLKKKGENRGKGPDEPEQNHPDRRKVSEPDRRSRTSDRKPEPSEKRTSRSSGREDEAGERHRSKGESPNTPAERRHSKPVKHETSPRSESARREELDIPLKKSSGPSGGREVSGRRPSALSGKRPSASERTEERRRTHRERTAPGGQKTEQEVVPQGYREKKKRPEDETEFLDLD